MLPFSATPFGGHRLKSLGPEAMQIVNPDQARLLTRLPNHPNKQTTAIAFGRAIQPHRTSHSNYLSQGCPTKVTAVQWHTHTHICSTQGHSQAFYRCSGSRLANLEGSSQAFSFQGFLSPSSPTDLQSSSSSASFTAFWLLTLTFFASVKIW